MVEFPEKSPEGCTIVLYRISDSDSSKFDHVSIVKALAMYADVKLRDNYLQFGYILIFDMSNCSLSHMIKTDFKIIKLSLQYYQVKFSIEV